MFDIVIQIFGWIGQLLLGLCAAPQAIQSFKTRTSNGINPLFIIMWFCGELLSLVYVLFSLSNALPIIMNYSVNLVFVSIILYYNVYPQNNNKNCTNTNESVNYEA
jgi:uncharacterized protein with PQ loop repeat